MKKMFESKTMAEIRAELSESVDKYNLSQNADERVELAMLHKDMVQAYNELSLLSAYGKCLAAEHPVVALAKTYYYDTISIKDTPHNAEVNGVMRSSITRSISDSNAKLNLTKFITWTAECNKNVAADKKWAEVVESSRKVAETEWKKYFVSKGDTHSFSTKKVKEAIQRMFDAVVFINSESGKNAVIATGDIAKWVIANANERKDSKVDTGVNLKTVVLSKARWSVLQMDALHMAVEGKSFDIVYGEEEPDADEAPAAGKGKGKTEPAAEADAQ